jgi:hypothetical protein
MTSRVVSCVRSKRAAGVLAALFATATVGVAGVQPAAAFDFFDGRLQVHGYGEAQIRALAKNYSWSDDFDLAQWYTVLGIEADINFAPDGIGPFDLVSGFVRLEARYDCVWTRACGVFPSVNVWGNRSKHLPNRLSDARKGGYTGSLVTGDFRRVQSIAVSQLGFEYWDEPVSGKREPAYMWHVPGVDTLFGVKDPLQTPQLSDDPAFYVFQRFVEPGHEYRFGLRKVKGQPNTNGIQVLGPWQPQNSIDPTDPLANIANPFNPLDVNPVLVPAAAAAGDPDAARGSAAMPFRPAPLYAAGFGAPNGQKEAARGLFIPNEAVARLIRNQEFDDFDQNFSEAELMWNRGASQDEKELKETFLDIEMLDSRLWIRAGKQNIVWGKTELFRTTDQFNPQDLALATLPSLEESRIALWALRGVYSFYSVGPLEDVRFELALNLDQMEPTDLGRCGEPYTPLPVCDKSGGLFSHGIAANALAGEIRPPDPWDDLSGLELGGRLEFRWDRYSFAISDFWGYDDFPYVDQVFLYERNVDPETGRPRRAGATGPCTTGNEPACLGPNDDALMHHHANQQRFALICASSVGFNNLDRSACAQSVFNSQNQAAPPLPPTVAETLGAVMSGSNTGRLLVQNFFIDGQPFPAVPLNHDSGDGPGSGLLSASSLSYVLSEQQEALLGCGNLWQTNCDTDGIDLLNAELSVLMQSWSGFPGTVNSWNSMTGPTGEIQPGTIRNCAANPGAPGCNDSTGLVPFVGGAVASRTINQVTYTLPGARSPFVAATDLRMGPVPYDASVDGCVSYLLGQPGCSGTGNELVQPYNVGAGFTTAGGDYYLSEMAAFSDNYKKLLIAFSRNDKTGPNPEHPCAPGENPNDCRLINEFVAAPAYLLRLDGCSYAKPELCSNVQALYSIAHTTRRDVKAGGNGHFGRTDFDWHQGGSGVLRYEKRNVLGFSMDFAEDVTKSNWGIETTWIEGNPFDDHDQYDSLAQADTFNVTVSVDRPTFINFLNAGRTFFFNTQWFFQYVDGYRDSFVSNGPFNVLATFHVDTGYFRDRLLPGITFVYDFNSASGAILPELQYRFTENFSATISANLFNGRFQQTTPSLRSIADYPFRAGQHQNNDWTEQGLAPIRDNDEVALRIRYTF